MTDDETWVDAEHANTLNAFDQGDVRTTHAVVEQASTLQAGGGERGNRLDAEMAAGGQLVAQAYSIREDAKADTFSATEIEAARCLQKHQPSVQSHHAQTFIAETYPINDGRDVEKHQNGTGIGDADAPAYTLDRQQRPAVVQTFTQNQRDEVRDLGTAAGALAAQPGMKQQTFIREQMTVRRLTPVECERLMGWPDGFTAPDGVKAPDSKRYAACGDGIVAPVAFWIADRIRMIEEEGGV